MILYGLLVILYILRTPPWQAPDEPAHWNYIATIAENGCCPRLESGDWDSDLLSELTSSRFKDASTEQISTLQYENHHPPLYYALAAPIFHLFSGEIAALRFWSAFLGLGIVLNAYRCGRILMPKQPSLAFYTALFVICLPQHLHLLSSINNDALAWLLISQSLYITLRWLRNLPLKREAQITSTFMFLGAVVLLFFSTAETIGMALTIILTGAIQLWLYQRQHPLADVWLLGILIGLIFITKTTAYLMFPLVLLVIVLHPTPQTSRIHKIFGALKPAFLIGATWWLRNLSIYGFPDFFGLIQHDRIVIGQLRTLDHWQQLGGSTFIGDFVRTTYTSFWGQFGWMALPLSNWHLLYTLFLSAIAIWGIWCLFKKPVHIPSIRVLIAITGFTIILFGLYNLSFVQWQGRYLYAALIPIAFTWAFGLRSIQENLGNSGMATVSLIAVSLPFFALEIAWRVLPGLNP